MAAVRRPTTGGDAVEDDEAPSAYEGWIGRVIDDRYAIEEVLAEGGMGAVFVASHVKLGRKVAVKVMHRELEGDDEIVRRFAREVEVTGRLQHRHIVSALDTGTMEDGSAYLVLELVTGRSLSEAIFDEGAFDWMRAAEIGAQIADALAAAHREGIVHRDLKPDNVVLEPDEDLDETVKLVDFGIAHVDASAAPRADKLTLAGAVLGTVGYMAPEQGLGQAVDGRADLYTLGVLLFEMLAGKSLFDEALSPSELVRTQLTGELPSVAEAAPDAPPSLVELVTRLLSHDVADRPGDAQAVRDALRALTAEAPPPPIVIDAETGDETGEASEEQAGGEEDQSTSARPPPAAAPPRPIRGRRRSAAVGAWLAGLVIIALLGAGAFYYVTTLEPAAPEGGGAGPIAPGPSADPIADPIEASLAVLVDDDAEPRARREAAEAILRTDPLDAVPALPLALARLEASEGCAVRTEAVRNLAELGDARAIGALRRHRDDRCGRRWPRQLDRAIRRIERASEASAP